MDRPTDRQTDRPTDIAASRVAFTRLKITNIRINFDLFLLLSHLTSDVCSAVYVYIHCFPYHDDNSRI